ncbi:hypothetical protein BDZ94DRAFT_1278217 [Collybia nuda]|uniref:Uncharacterized protein n=1 Tax=Collybia nuda TaxID=64659 RepID=A0A9P6C804_9AGAR|nr:hypothetical protein BDZ94DRAFT_1278217 [Collybia nuda]
MCETPWKAGQYYLWWTMVQEEGYSYSWLLSTKAWRADLSITLFLYASDIQSFHDPTSNVLAIIRDRPKSILGLGTGQTFVSL